MNVEIIDSFRIILEQSKQYMSVEEYEIKLKHLNSWKEWTNYVDTNRRLFYTHTFCVFILFPYWIYREIKADKLSKVMMKNLDAVMEVKSAVNKK